MCVVFSDPLPVSDPNLADFVVVEGGSGPRRSSRKDNQICVDGLKHGSRYTLRVRAGLPSADGETLAQSAEISSYVRDRAPWVGFAGNAYVLPAGQGASIPIDTRQRRARSPPRSTASAIARSPIAVRDGTFLRQLDSYSAGQIASQSGQSIWTGEIEVPRSKPNETVTTAIPIGDALKKVEPGVYVITAQGRRPPTNDYYGDLATQWFIVSDLGLSALSGNDGIHAIIRSLEHAPRRWPASRSSSSPPMTRCSARRRPMPTAMCISSPASRAATAAWRRNSSSPRPAGGDYAFLDLKKTAFDLTDRGVDGRPAPGKLDTFLTTRARHLSPRRDGAPDGAAARCARRGPSPDLPLTLVVDRPDGVEFLRTQIDGSGRRRLCLRHDRAGRAPSAAPGASSSTPIPMARRSTEISTLVDDFEPERIAFELDHDREAADLGRELPDRTHRQISLRRQGDRPRRRWRDHRDADQHAKRDYPGYSFGLADDPVETVRDSLGARRDHR